MSKKIPIEMFDRDLQECKAEAQRRDDFANLFDDDAVGARDGILDIELFRRFFADRRRELVSGVIAKYDFPIWDTIGKVLSFNMEYFYSYIDAPAGKQASNDDICSDTGWLAEEGGQREIHEALKGCLVAAGALARQIESSTYDGFRQLLVEREFKKVKGSCFFESEEEFGVFLKRYTELLHLLWADNEIARQISATQVTPHISKKGKKADK